jgi:two-component system, chemotaxis family, protein-glutamate methylesterase/glutaminase
VAFIQGIILYNQLFMPANFILVIGTSAGGTMVIPELLSQLRKEMNMAVFVVIHMTKRSVGDMFVKRAQKNTVFKCKIPRNGEAVKAGMVYFAKPDHHLLVKENKIILGKGPMENRYRPSIDALFRSAAAGFDHKVIGVILTGMLEDGVAGMVAIKRSGGHCIIQDPNEAQYSDMPQAALRNVKADYVVSVERMGDAIANIIAAPGKKSKIPDDVKREAQISQRVLTGIDLVSDLGSHSLFSCPDCGGGLWRVGSNGNPHYRCHVGHVFTENSLLGAMEVSTESALWTAMRIIEEKRNLLKNLAAKETANGNKQVASRYRKRIKELEAQIQQLKNVLFSSQQD